MSASSPSILNDRDLSPIPTNRHQSPPTLGAASSQPAGSPINNATTDGLDPSVVPSTSQANAHKRRHGSSSPEPDPPNYPPVPSSPFKRLRLETANPAQPLTPAVVLTPTVAASTAPQPRADAPFNIFSALLAYPELTLEYTKHLPVDTLLSLYAISQRFHFLVNARFTTLIMSHALAHSPESAGTFIFRCYASLCHFDPAARENLARRRRGTVRWVPTFKWLKMIHFREMVVDEIITLMASEGHAFPDGMSLAIKKIWFTMDISDNFRRVGFMHNRTFWTDADLYLATEFIIKLDMRLTHPVTGTGDTGLRKMLLGQRSLSMLWKVLRREAMRTQLDMLRMVVRWNYEPPRDWNQPIMGVPPEQIGMLQWEGWGAAGRHCLMMQIDQLVMREGIRRRLKLEECWVDMVLDGFVDKEKWVNFRVDQEVVVETVPEEDEVHDDAWASTDEESEAEEDSDDDDDDEEGPELTLDPGRAMSPDSQARAGGGDMEGDSGPRTHSHPRSEEADTGVGDSGKAGDEDAMDETA